MATSDKLALDKLSRDHLRYVKKHYTDKQYDEFIRVSGTVIKQAADKPQHAILPSEIRDSIVLWINTVNVAKRSASFEELMADGAFGDAYAMIIIAAILLDDEQNYFQCIYQHSLPRYALKGYVAGGVECGKLVNAVRGVLHKDMKIISNPIKIVAWELRFEEKFCNEVFKKLTGVEADSFFTAKQAIESAMAVDTSRIDKVYSKSQDFADAISNKDVRAMEAIIAACGAMVAMIPITNKRGHKISPMYHCFMSILAEYQSSVHEKTEFVDSEDTLIDLPVPQVDKSYMEAWGNVLTRLRVTVQQCERAYPNFARDFRKDKYGLFAPYETSVWCGTDEPLDMLTALVHAGGDCTLQRPHELAHFSTAAYIHEWARLQRRQRRVAWIARVLFISVFKAPPAAAGGELLMRMLVSGQLQLAYELCIAYPSVVKLEDPYNVFAKMIKDPNQRDTANGIITTLLKTKLPWTAQCSADVAKKFIEYPATLDLLLTVLDGTTAAGIRRDIESFAERKLRKVEKEVNHNQKAMPRETMYIKMVEYEALNRILNRPHSVFSWPASSIMPLSHMAMSNPLLPPFVYAY